jgi:hypothetical protein
MAMALALPRTSWSFSTEPRKGIKRRIPAACTDIVAKKAPRISKISEAVLDLPMRLFTKVAALDHCWWLRQIEASAWSASFMVSFPLTSASFLPERAQRRVPLAPFL